MNRYLLLILTWVFCSCGDFLSESSQEEMKPKTTSSFSEILWGEGYYKYSFESMIAYMDDDITCRMPYNKDHDKDDIMNKELYTWQPHAADKLIDQGNESSVLPWKKYYQKIKGCNIVLEYAGNSVGEQKDKDHLMGEAHVLRAFYYFQLVNLYGWPYNDTRTSPEKSLGVPLVLAPEIGGKHYARASVAEVYEQIVKDVEEGVRLLEKEKRQLTNFRLHHVSAHLLASRIYLYMNKWDKALEHARYVTARYDLPDFTGYTDTEYKTKSLYRPLNDEIMWYYGSKNVVSSLDMAFASSSYEPASGLYALFDEDHDVTDKRKTFYFLQKTDYTGTVLLEVKKWTSSTSDYGLGLRASEAYLNEIEAFLEKYNEGDAEAGREGLQRLNAFRAKRLVAKNGDVLPEIPMQAAEDLLEIYRKERRKELCYEGQRWFDLRRYGMPRLEKPWMLSSTEKEIFVLEECDPMYALDIPTNVMDLNEMLEQNPNVPNSGRMPSNN